MKIPYPLGRTNHAPIYSTSPIKYKPLIPRVNELYSNTPPTAEPKKFEANAIGASFLSLIDTEKIALLKNSGRPNSKLEANIRVIAP